MTTEKVRFQIGDRVSIKDPRHPVLGEFATVVFVNSGTYLLNHNTFFQEVVKLNPCDNCVVCCLEDEEMECVRSCDKLKKIGSLTIEELLMDENPFIHQAGLRLFKEQSDGNDQA